MAEQDQTTVPSFSDEQIPLTHTPRRAAALDAGQDTRLVPVEFPFAGAWAPDEDPLKIGPQNFADLQNYRYSNSGLVGTAGYSRLTSAPVGAAIQNGVHFTKVIAGTPRSYVLVQSAAPNIYAHTATIPATGNFGSALLPSEAGGGLARFATAPDGTVLMCDGVYSTIWGSPEHRCAAFINYDGLSSTFRYDFTGRVTNTLTDAANLATLARDATPDIWLLIGSTRPVQGIKFYVQTANTTAATTTVEFWNGAWNSIALTDGTALAGVTFAQTGTLSFASTASLVHPFYSDGRLLYFYRVRLGSTGTPDATIQVSHCTVDAPLQRVVDIWDGVERSPIYASNASTDYTLEVQQPSPVSAPQALVVNGGMSLTVVFEQRLTALHVTLNGNKHNSTAAVVTIYYWNGTAFASAGTVEDTTLVSGATLGVSGTWSWQPPAVTSEFPVSEQTPAYYNFGGVPGYVYFIAASAPLGAGSDVLIDTITGIPAPRWDVDTPVPGYRFPFTFGGRTVLANRASSNEPHRLDYSAPGQPDVWNGTQSSAQGKQIYVGTTEALSCAIELANRYAGELTSLAIVLKNSETWLWQGTTPDTFTLYRVSDIVGCPAPLSLTLAEIPVSQTDLALRTVALWCSAKGPYMCDGSVLLPMRFPLEGGHISSVECYFNPDDSRYVNTTYWERVAGWYDAQHSEYNLVLPSGSGATTCNTWLVCDLLRRKWYRKVPSAYPQCGWQVEDTTGTPYIYAGLTSGHLLRLENGTTWDGTNITHVVDTADIILPLTRAEGSFWDETLMRYMKVLALAESGATATLTCQHAPNGTGTFTTFTSLSLASAGGRRWNRQTTPTNLRSLSHQFRFSATTSDKARAPRLLGFGALVRTERMTFNDTNS